MRIKSKEDLAIDTQCVPGCQNDGICKAGKSMLIHN